MSKIIGGEFEISPSLYERKGEEMDMFDGFYYSSGRAALYYILQNIKIQFPIIDTILLPNYLCHSIIETVNQCNYKIRYYELTNDLTIQKEKFCMTKKDAVLVINYFGLSYAEPQIEYIHHLDAQNCIILDNVQAFYEIYNQTNANYSFTSFRKWFPTPDGAVVKTKMDGMYIPEQENTFAKYKVAGAILKKFRNKKVILDDVYLSLFEKGEQLISQNLNTKISDISKCIFANLKINEIAQRRQENAEFLIEELKTIGIKPVFNLNDKTTPLFIPIKILERDIIRSALFQKNIFCPVHWFVSEDCADNIANDFSTNELSIVIDQRYDKTDMLRIVETIKQCLFI